MINFTYTNDDNVSFEEKDKTKAAFLEKSGSLKNEFEEKNGAVTIDFMPKDGNDYDYYFDIENRVDFIEKWNKEIQILNKHS